MIPTFTDFAFWKMIKYWSKIGFNSDSSWNPNSVLMRWACEERCEGHPQLTQQKERNCVLKFSWSSDSYKQSDAPYAYRESPPIIPRPANKKLTPCYCHCKKLSVQPLTIFFTPQMPQSSRSCLRLWPFKFQQLPPNLRSNTIHIKCSGRSSVNTCSSKCPSV